ncbi:MULTISPECIES: acetyl-CoA acetyltransferase [Rhodococcus]|uniref:acetyl-CoA acetyltransferase n=1 Tax=Rhodococcus TaxID=1827 RepID=UPI001E4E2AF1|nr:MULTISPECIES: acetyl-CoA acetyltransferase [Rhodococcus]BDB59440.1 acetyl-CoA acetyltransferase [Rhodococcus sp. RDE2]
MTPEPVWIAGGYQSDFSRNLTKEGLDLSGLTAEIVKGTLDSSNIPVGDIDVIHVANAFGQVYTGQGHLSAMPASVEPELWNVPATRHEGACGSGSLAILAAMADLESGRYDCALVVGVELERNVPGDLGAQYMEGAAWIGHEGQDAKYMWPYMFSRVAEEYDKRYGVDPQHLWSIAELNTRNARRNPNAQTRVREYGPASFTADDEANPVVEGRLHKADCGPLTDGGAGVILLSERYLAARPELREQPMSRILGWGHRTVGLLLEEKLARSADTPLMFPHVAGAIEDAFTRAGIEGVDDLDLIETHDCFTVSEYMAIDHFGITPPGESWRAVESGDLEIGGRIPMNPSGGLLGGGHPVGATGVRMLLDCHRQVNGSAGDYQVADARRAGMLNFGGSTTTTVSFVVG